MTKRQAMAKVNNVTRDIITREAIKKIGVDTVAKRKAVSIFLRQRGVTYDNISAAIGVSRTAVIGYVQPEVITDSRRRTTLGTTIGGKRVLLTGLNKREYTVKCELCDKVPKKMLYYHHWLDDFPSVGMWLCYTCHQLAESLDNRRELIDKYTRLKNQISIEFIRKDLEELESLAILHKQRFVSKAGSGL